MGNIKIYGFLVLYSSLFLAPRKVTDTESWIIFVVYLMSCTIIAFLKSWFIWFYCRRIYPPEDKTLLEKYENLLAVAFQTFLSGRAASFQRELNNPLKRMKVKEWMFIKKKKRMKPNNMSLKTTHLSSTCKTISLLRCTFLPF